MTNEQIKRIKPLLKKLVMEVKSELKESGWKNPDQPMDIIHAIEQINDLTSNFLESSETDPNSWDQHDVAKLYKRLIVLVNTLRI